MSWLSSSLLVNNRGRNKRLKHLPQISGLDFAVVLLGLFFKEWEHISQKKSSWLLSLQDPFSQQKWYILSVQYLNIPKTIIIDKNSK